MVERASALAQFKRAREAFVGKRAIGFGDGDPIYVSDLHPSLLGYEMLAVSSNNTAVQNLSHELPLREQLDASWAHLSYLEPVAQRLFETKEVWGLIAAALGNRQNCRQLVNRVFFDQDEKQEGARIWDWATDYAGPTFAEARERFLSLQAEQEALIEEIDTFAQLHNPAAQETLLQEIECAEERAAEIQEELTSLEKEVSKAEELLALLTQRVQLWEKEKQNQELSEWTAKASEYTQQQIAAVEEIHAKKERTQTLEEKLEKINQSIDTNHLEIIEWSAKAEEYKERKSAFPDLSMPQGTDELDDPEVQKQSYYQNPALNQSRSELFVAAMTLHEAWLAETLCPQGGLRGNLAAISNLLQGKTPTTEEDTLLVWQSLFLLIPLITSTFASIGRLFRHLPPRASAGSSLTKQVKPSPKPPSALFGGPNG